MTKTTQPAATSKLHAIKRRLPKARADERGLTTLEWLLIVAAVAGLAALAVVLVQTVVSDTSEQIAGSSARRTAAEVAAAQVEQEAKNADITDDLYDNWAKWENYFTSKCDRIAIVYSDAGISEMTSDFNEPTTTATLTGELLQAATTASAANAVQVQCEVP
ncbi:hypothetical protein [Candidatus Poriferisodalis sp.]|uniref:hypothetical protein n=1 Tax=Candidatus Poriferisodalis sp. TaxID=3101277 RepID=UPI003B52FF15